MMEAAYEEVEALTAEDKARLLRMRMGNVEPWRVEAEKARRSLHYFIKSFWDVVSGDPFVDNWHISYLCGEIEKVFQRVRKRQDKEYDLIVNIPPGTTKSTILTKMFPVWAWINDPIISIITGSYSSALAMDHSDASRDVMNSDRFRKWFPWMRIRSGVNTKSKFQIEWVDKDRQLHMGGTRFATSVGGTVTGMHGHIIIVDDPINPLDSEQSSLARKEANSWIDRTLSSRKSIKLVTPIILIMQRLHQEDPTGHYLSLGLPVRHLRLPAEIRPDDPNTLPDPPELASFYRDGLLDPVRLDRQVLKQMLRQLGQFGYAGQFDQRPIPPGGGMFKTGMLHSLVECPLRSKARRKVMYWDKAASVSRGDWTVGLQMWEMAGRVVPKYVIVKIVRGRWDANERERRIREEAQIAGRDVVQVIEQEPGSGGKESAEATVRNLVGFVVKLDRPTGSKTLRADVFATQVNNGNVGLLVGPWSQAFTEEMEYYPFAKHDDQIDAGSGAINFLSHSRRGGAW